MRATNAIRRLREQLGDAATTAAVTSTPSTYPQGYIPPLPRTPSDPISPGFARVLPAYPADAMDYGVSPAQIAPSQIAPNSERLGVARGGDALPVWPTRLHGMRDFAATLSYEPGEFDPAPYTLTPPFAVPAGYIAIVRRYRFLIEPPVVAVSPATATLSFLLDGQPVPYLSGIPVDSFMTDYSDLWLEANAFQNISAQLSVVDGNGDPVELGVVRIMVMLYGELRRPGPYAPANTCCYDDLPPPAPLPVPEAAPPATITPAFQRKPPVKAPLPAQPSKSPPPKAPLPAAPAPAPRPQQRSLPSPVPTAKALPVFRRSKRR